MINFAVIHEGKNIEEQVAKDLVDAARDIEDITALIASVNIDHEVLKTMMSNSDCIILILSSAKEDSKFFKALAEVKCPKIMWYQRDLVLENNPKTRRVFEFSKEANVDQALFLTDFGIDFARFNHLAPEIEKLGPAVNLKDWDYDFEAERDRNTFYCYATQAKEIRLGHVNVMLDTFKELDTVVKLCKAVNSKKERRRLYRSCYMNLCIESSPFYMSNKVLEIIASGGFPYAFKSKVLFDLFDNEYPYPTWDWEYVEQDAEIYPRRRELVDKHNLKTLKEHCFNKYKLTYNDRWQFLKEQAERF